MLLNEWHVESTFGYRWSFLGSGLEDYTWNNYSTSCETGSSPYLLNLKYLIIS